MLTPERHQLILSLLKEKDTVRINELVDVTGASESTIRRDLSELEEQSYLKHVHGGASSLQNKIEEPTMLEKSVKYEREKTAIAKYAASLMNERDSIFIDAGSTTSRVVPFLPDENIVVVTNSPDIGIQLIKRNIKTFLIGGELKVATWSLVGRDAIKSIGPYRYDKCFIGTNGIDPTHGLTTPDPDEAYVKQLALQYSYRRGDLSDVTIVTDEGMSEEDQFIYSKLSTVKVVKS